MFPVHPSRPPSGLAPATVRTPASASLRPPAGPTPEDLPLLFSLSTADAAAVTVAVGLAVLAVVAVGALDHLTDGSLRDRLAPAALGSESGSSVPPTSALSEEERFVVELLRRRGGRVHQSAIVEASDWSKSKVSRLLSSMAAEGYVEKRSVGRENVISLPGEDPEE